MQEHGEVGWGCLELRRPIMLWLDTSQIHGVYMWESSAEQHQPASELLSRCTHTLSQSRKDQAFRSILKSEIIKQAE